MLFILQKRKTVIPENGRRLTPFAERTHRGEKLVNAIAMKGLTGLVNRVGLVRLIKVHRVAYLSLLVRYPCEMDVIK